MTIFSGQNSVLLPLIVAVLALVLAGYNFISLRSLNKLRKAFFSSPSGGNLEDIVQTLHRELAGLHQEHLILEQALSQLQRDFGFAVQKIGLVRFNPFGDDGGNFSFCLALLDGHDTGVVLTSMHGRQQNRIYTKRIVNGASEVPLTEEEQKAMTGANIMLTKHPSKA